MLNIKINFRKIRSALRLFKLAYGRYRWQILLTTFLGFIAGLAGSVGISAIIPLFSFATGQALGPTDAISEYIRKVFDFLNVNYTLAALLTFMLFLFIAKAVFIFIANYTTSKITLRYLRESQKLSLQRTLQAQWPFLLNQKIGYLDRVIIEDTPYSGSILMNITDISLRLASLATYAFVAFKISLPITLLTLAGGSFIFLVFKPLYYRSRKIAEKMNVLSKEVTHFINESMIGIKTIKSTGIENAVAKKGTGYFEEIERSQFKSQLLGYLQGSVFEPASFIFIIGVFTFYYQAPNFNIASFAVIIYLIQKMFSFMQGIQAKFSHINTSLPYLNTMIKYQQEAKQHKETTEAGKPFKFEKSLELKDLSYVYAGTKKKSLSNVSFTISRGETIGIIGPSGAGKTTLVDILLHLLTPQSGSILLDNENASLISKDDWRSNVSYVSQDIFLMHDTVEVNIQFYNKGLTRKEIAEAAKLANIYNFVQTLPEKFKTIVGERGVKLSGGQRQRIVLARALARKPRILILDEATSALDNESEALIQQAITDLKGKITVIMIAHRLTTVMNCDKLIVLDQGKIIDSGSPNDLMDNKESYLYKSFHATTT